QLATADNTFNILFKPVTGVKGKTVVLDLTALEDVITTLLPEANKDIYQEINKIVQSDSRPSEKLVQLNRFKLILEADAIPINSENAKVFEEKGKELKNLIKRQSEAQIKTSMLAIFNAPLSAIDKMVEIDLLIATAYGRTKDCPMGLRKTYHTLRENLESEI